MNRKIIIPAIVIALVLVYFFLNPVDKFGIAPGENWAPNLLPEEVKGTDIRRSSDIRIFPADSLWVYIDGAADEYLKHRVMEVATADYKEDAAEVVVDIYRFAGANMAQEMYVSVFGNQSDKSAPDSHSAVSGTTIDFVRGVLFVRLTAFEESQQSSKLMLTLAEKIENKIK